MLFRFSLYGFLKNQRYFEPFLMLVFLEQGLSFFEIGLLIACREVTVNLLEIPSGVIADSCGRRRSMIVSFIAYILSFLTFAMATHWGWFYPAMVLFGIGESFRTGTHKAMIFEWLRLRDESEERTRIYGYTRSWSQIGSAVSGILAAVWVILSNDYRTIFWFATIPYLINIANFAGYPKELDGDHFKSASLSTLVRRLTSSFKKSFGALHLRRLMLETMGWEGVFRASKDYLQPVLATVVVVVAVGQWHLQALTEVQSTAVLIGVVYSFLFLLSSWASRSSHRFASRAGGNERAARRLWIISACLFAGLGAADLAGWLTVVILAFVSLHVLENIWRPILISRFDSFGDPAEGATILSIESQAQRTATLILAPLVGLAIDFVQYQALPGQFWPIGLLGCCVAVALWTTAPRASAPGD